MLRAWAPPEAARLLPDSDAVLYVNLKPVRAALLGNMPGVDREADYAEFVRATGIEFERDLDEAAFAIHSGAAAGAPERYSEVMIGRFDSARLAGYLRRQSNFVERYRDIEIFHIPRQGRTLRMAILSMDTVAGSNADDSSVVRGVIDRYKKIALPFGGPALLKRHYGDVPFLSPVWVVGRVPPPGSAPSLFPELVRKHAAGAALVASLRYSSGLQMTAQIFFPDSEQQRAEKLAASIGTLVQIYRTLAPAAASDDGSREFADSIQIEREQGKVTLTATIPESLLKQAKVPPTEPVQPSSPQKR